MSIMEHYLTIKRNEVLTYATTWINLENILVRERQTQKPNIDSIYMKCPDRQIHRDRKCLSGYLGLEVETSSYCK